MSVSIQWLVRLRWAIAVGQLGLIGLVWTGRAPAAWPIQWLIAVLVVGLVSNAALAVRFRSGRALGEPIVAAVILLDTVLLTGLLAVTGGTSSPLSTLYLLPVVAATFTLRPNLAWIALVATALEYGALFAWGPAPPHHHDHTEMQAHVVGMFLAYAFTAPLLAVAVSRTRSALAHAARRIDAARALQLRSEHLASLATLAAGASHELATPLSTIMLVAHELERSAPDEPTREDLALIREEVLRCQAVLQQMSADAGAPEGELDERLTLQTLVEDTLGHGARFEPVEVAFEVDAATEVELPRRLVVQALRRLLGNARDATGDGAPVELVIRATSKQLELVVRYRGAGMPREVLERATEPFYSTKAEGSGSGLGLFFVTSVAEHQNGEFDLQSEVGVGTTATLRIPLTSRVQVA
jgi:two-component system sensor histidine kinase RegB